MSENASAELTLNDALVRYIVKCPRCPCLFLTETDLKAHLNIFGDHSEDSIKHAHRQVEYGVETAQNGWRKGAYGDFRPSDELPETKRLCQIKGTVTNGLFKITLSENGKWLKRKHI